MVDVAVPVVGLGASAGGLQAYSAFLDAAPSDCGAAFVLVHHVDPDHKSLMADLLAKHTSMPVVLAEDESQVQADHVYVIPPNNYLEIKNGVLGGVRQMQTSLCKDSKADPYAAPRPRHSARAAARLSLKFVRLERLRS